MRIVALSIIILALFYNFLPVRKDGVQIDDIKVKLSGPSREEKEPIVKARPAFEEAKIITHEGENFVAEDEQKEDPESDAGATVTEEDDDAQVEVAPESDQEKSWQDELSQVLVNLEPEYGEEIFNSYVNERNSFQSSLEELIRANQKNQDLEELIGDLETRHEEKVKEIFGRHYEEIKAHETKFLESESP